MPVDAEEPGVSVDLLGRPLDADEQALLDSYEGLKALLDRPLAPCAAANVRAALAAMWNAVNDLALTHEHLVDHDV